MAWYALILAGLLEIIWAIGLTYTDGFTEPLPTLITVVAMILSLFLLELSLDVLPVGTAYAVWTGIGAVGTAIVGIILFDESANIVRVACLGMIVAGIAGLHLTSTGH